jgi:hypothetical protein
VQSYEGSADLSRAQHFKAHELWRVHADRAHTLEALIVLTECILDWDRLGGGDVVTGTPFFFSRDAGEVLFNKLFSPRKSIAPTHDL